jgi:hypothetical protein
MKKAVKLQRAATKAKNLIDRLHSENPSSPQWVWPDIERDIKDTYLKLREVRRKKLAPDNFREFVTEDCFKLLSARDTQERIPIFDLLSCLDQRLDDMVIISVLNFLGEQEDKLIVWLDHEVGENNLDEMELEKLDQVEDFKFFDNFPSLSGLGISLIGRAYFQAVGHNDCWTFKWSPEKERWLLDFVIFDRMTDAYLSVIGNSLNAEEYS